MVPSQSCQQFFIGALSTFLTSPYDVISIDPFCIHFQVWNYISDCGGTLGLWLGCSIITLFEFFELLSDLLIFSCLRFLGCHGNARDAARGGSVSNEAENRRPSDLEIQSVRRGPPESVRSLSGIVLPGTPKSDNQRLRRGFMR